MKIAIRITPLTVEPAWVKSIFLVPLEFSLEDVCFYPESRPAFTLPELKEIVKEMEKLNDIRPE